ncbi:MAG: hypothetical protein KIT10_02860 [Flavobacteriales bacterium]|nr:hypothetical protein [Flavobacteriales bacterium]
MENKLMRLSCLLVLLAGMSLRLEAQHARHGQGHDHHGHDHQHDDLRALLNMHDQRINFTENKGQFSEPVLFRADFPLGQAIATREGMVVTAFDPVEVEKRVDEGFRIEDDILRGLPHRELEWRRKGHAWQLHFLGASPAMRIDGVEGHEELNHYFLGDDPSRHATHVRSFQEVWYRDVYPGVDVRYYPAEDGSLEYDIICKPGSDPSRIAIEFRGIEKMRVDDKGQLFLETSLGEMSYPAPYVYQRINGREDEVRSAFRVEGNVLRFELDAHDRREPLVIDPIAMRWATWVNTNSTGDNHGHCIWVDPSDGAIYMVARVVGTTDQITPGAFDVTGNGNLDIIIGKYLEPDNVGDSGTRVWQTYLGGGGDDNPYAMEQGPDGHLYITGNTTSTNYPMLGGTLFSGSSINQQAQTGADIFLTKIDRDGTSIKSAVVGGNQADLSFDLRIGANGDVVVCGYTQSTNLATVNPGVGATNSNAGGRDVIVFKIEQDLNTLSWLRNYGGSANDQAMIMLQAANGDIFIGGLSASTNFPTVSPRQNTRGGTQAGILQRLNSTGTTLWSSYFSSATNQTASILCMEFNTTQTELYFGGITSGLPASNIGPVGVYDNSAIGSNDFFVCRMSTNQDFIASTYVGGSGNEENMMGLNVDLNNDVYVFGYSGSTNFPISTAPNVPLQATNQGSRDKVFFKLESDLSALEFSTYYGGTADDYDPVGERGIKFSNCRIYTIVTARSNNIPLTQGALNTTKLSASAGGGAIYEPGLVIWANPPDLLDNAIFGNQSVCAGELPADITGTAPSYVLPTIVRNNVPSAYPPLGAAATYQWQTSADSINWVDIPGANGQNLPGALLGPIDEKTYVRRIIGGDACILAGAADQVVTVKLISVSAQVQHVSCNGFNDGTITATSDGVGPFLYSWAHGPDTETVSDLAPGFYTVTVTDINGCSAEGTFQVTEPTVLSAQAQVTDATCNTSNGSATASANGGTAPYQYLWDTGAVGATLSGVPGGLYEVTVTDANLCTFLLPVQIGSTGVPDITAGPAGLINCTSGPEIQLAGGSTTPGVTYAWVASNGGNIVSGADQADPTVNAAGTYTLTVTAPNNCFATEATTVTIDTATPDADASVADVLTCDLTSVQLEGTSTTVGVSFAWIGPGGFTSDEQNPSVTTAGLYILTVTDPSNGCTNTAQVQVDEDVELPGASASGGTITCDAPCVTLSGSGNGTFAWTGPNGFESSEQNPEVCATGTYVLTVTGENGCTSTANANVGEDIGLPGASASGGTITCDAPCVTLSGSGNGTFAWTGPNGFESSEQNPEVCATGTYVLTVTGENGCTSTANANVGEDIGLPGASASGGTITCDAPCVTLSGSGNGTFAWTGPNGFESSEQNPEVCATGTYVLTVTGENGCTSTANANVGEDIGLPGASASGGTITCDAPCVTLSGSGNGTFAWTGPNGFESSEQNPEVCATGTYVLTVTGTNGCTSTANANVGEDIGLPGASASGGTITCDAPCVTLSGSGNGTFAWTGPNGFESSEQNPEVCATGTYVLTVTGTNGCTSTANANVGEDIGLPGASASGGTITCDAPCVTLSGSGNGTFAWTGPNGFESSEQNPEVCATGTYVLTVTGTNGCTSTANANVGEDIGLPGASASGGTITCDAPCVTLSGSGNGTFAWTGPNGFESSEQNPEVCATGTYVLTVTGENGCTSTANANVGEDIGLPGASASGGTITCDAPCVTLSGSGNGTFAWTGPNGFESSEQNPEVCATGTYVLTVTGENGCTSTANANVGEDIGLPGASASGGTITCDAPCVTLSGSGNGTFAWTGPNGFESSEQNPEVCATGTYVLTVTGTNGCTSTANANVGEDIGLPGASASGGTITCDAPCVTLSGSGNGTFAWTGPNGFESSEQNPEVCATGTYVLTVTGTNGCTSTANANVGEDIGLPGASASGGTITCDAPCVTLSGSGNGTFAWTGPNGFESSEQNPEVCATGTYVLTVTGTNGCTSTANANVGEDIGLPGASASGGTITCDAPCVTLSGSGNGTFAWTGPNGFESSEQNPEVCATGTYVLTVTGTNGCTSTANANVGEDIGLPGASASGGTITCDAPCVTLSGSGNGTFAWTGPNGFESSEQNPEVCATGTYVLTVTGTNGCTSTANANVGEDIGLPGASASGGTITCDAPCVTLSGSGNGTFAWTGPNGFESSEQNPEVCATGTYVLTVTGTNGCTSTANANVGEDIGLPGASASGGTITCDAPCVTLSGSGNGTFAWTGPNGFESSEQNPEVCATGTYVLTVTGTNGCTSTANANVGEDIGLPGASASGGTITCDAPCVTLSGSGNGTFAWTGPNGFESSEQNPEVCATGTYVLTVTGENGCTSTANANVGEDIGLPGASASGGTITCDAPCVTLSGSGNGTFAWTGPNGFESSEQNPEVCATGTYVLTVTGENGCTSTANANVGEDIGLPGASASGGTITCDAPCVTLSGSGNGTFAWTGPNGFESSEQNPEVCATGTYVLTVTGTNGCTSTANANVGEDIGLPGASASGGTITCDAPCVTLSGSGNGTFAWTGPNGFESSEQNPEVCATGTYVLTVTGTNGCTSTANANVGEDIGLPGASASGGTITCDAPCVTLSGSGNGTFAWTGPNGFESSEQNPEVCATGTYVLTVTGTNGCTSTANANVGEDIGLPGASASGGTITCDAPCVTLSGSGNGTFAWTGPNGFESSEQNPEVCATGTYVLTVTGENGCTSTANANVGEDIGLPGASASGGTITCDAPCVTLSGSGNGTFAWTGPNGFESSEQNPEVCATGTYVLTVTGTNGCTSTANANVGEDIGLPGASASGGTITCDAPCVTLSGSGNGTFAWTGPNGFESSEQNPEVCATGTYVLTVTGTNGCTSTANANVGEEPCDECPPMIISCDADTTIECGDSIHPLDVGHPIFRKDEECPQVYVSWGDEWFGSCPYTLVRHWTAWDDLGNVEYCVQTITVIDTQPPVINNLPADIIVDCHSVPEASCEVWAADACKDWYHVYVTDKIEEGDCPDSYVIQRVYWAVDDCGNYGFAIQTITVIDQNAPVLHGVPSDITVACDAVPAMANVWAEDLCDPNVSVLAEETMHPGNCAGNYQLVRMWSAVDACGNPVAAAQLITVVDEEPPVFLCDLADMTVHCYAVPEPPDCQAEDNCDDNVTIDMVEEKTGSNCKKPYVITWTWTATDGCGNATTVVQTINVTNKQWPFVVGNDPNWNQKMLVEVSPNPFRDRSMIKFIAPESGMATVEILDLAGRSVALPFQGQVQEGQEVRALFAPVENGSGTYLYRIVLNDIMEHGRLIHQP